MEKILAIKGHKSRGNEVIKLLEMMGGINSHNLYGDESYAYYTIDSDKEIKGGIYVFGDEDLSSFTLEEFLEKFPYKVGDKVNYVKYNDEYPNVYTIQNMQWNGTTIEYLLDSSGFSVLTKDLQPFKEEPMEENIKEKDCFLEYEILNGYEFDKIENGKIILKQIKPKYPTTYEDCCKVLGISYRTQLSYTNPDVERGNTYLTKEKQLLDSFMRLRICRNAYWKIAGDEIGMGEPWGPRFDNCRIPHYCIFINHRGEVCNDCFYGNRCLLTFPTKEMRDAFYEKFKDLIEQCKELL